MRTEYLRQYREMAVELITKARNANKDLWTLPDWGREEPPQLPDSGNLTTARASALDKAFALIVDCPPERALEALHREADHLAPAEDGKGARDAGIWFTVLSYAEKHADQPIYFVTADNDFRQNGALHPTLRAEAPTNLHLVKDEITLIKNFNGEADSPLTAGELASVMRVRNTVEVAAYGMQVEWDLARSQRLAQGFPLSRAYFSASPTTEYELLPGAHVKAVHVGDDLWVTMRGTWHLARPMYTMPEGDLPTQTFEVVFDIPMTLIIALAGKEVTEVHVLTREQAKLQAVRTAWREVSEPTDVSVEA